MKKKYEDLLSFSLSEKKELLKQKKNTENAEWTNITVRITKNLINEIDNSRKTRVGISRNCWILGAIQNELKST